MLFFLWFGLQADSFEQYNFVWISVEDMSPWLGCYGDDTVATPNVDRLAASGTLYTHAYANAPVCAPARATLITGCYATAIGAMHMRTGNPSKAALRKDPTAYDNIPSYEATPPADVRCFPELLRMAGYYCTNSAKKDYQFKAPVTVWDESGRKAHWKNRPDASQPFFAVFNLGMTHESGTFSTTRRRPPTVNPAEVKVPPYYPDTDLVRQDIARTYDNIAIMDAQVGKIIQDLEEADLMGRTIIFFFSDHGVGLPRGKRCVYDSGTKVPLIIRHPSMNPTVTDRLVSFVDFAPTMISMAGMKPPKWMMGHAFAGTFETQPQKFVFFHADRMDSKTDRTRAVTDGRFRFIQNDFLNRPRIYPVDYAENIPMMADIHALRASGELTQDQWQLSLAPKPAQEFYELESDPHEIHNRAGEQNFAPEMERLESALLAWQTRTGDLGLLPEMEMVKTRLWPPAGVQPKTQPPVLVTLPKGGWIFQSPTSGASVGWRKKGEKRWNVAPGPVQLEEGVEYEAIAHRIGFHPAAYQSLGKL